MILLISASHIARITGVSHLRPANSYFSVFRTESTRICSQLVVLVTQNGPLLRFCHQFYSLWVNLVDFALDT
jgi:hypothetical protein